MEEAKSAKLYGSKAMQQFYFPSKTKPVGNHPGSLFWNAQKAWHLINREIFIRVWTTWLSQAASSCWLNVTRIFFTSSFQSWARGGFGGDSRLLQTSYSRKQNPGQHKFKEGNIFWSIAMCIKGTTAMYKVSKLIQNVAERGSMSNCQFDSNACWKYVFHC